MQIRPLSVLLLYDFHLDNNLHWETSQHIIKPAKRIFWQFLESITNASPLMGWVSPHNTTQNVLEKVELKPRTPVEFLSWKKIHRPLNTAVFMDLLTFAKTLVAGTGGW